MIAIVPTPVKAWHPMPPSARVAAIAPAEHHLPKVYGETMIEMPRDLYIPPDAL